MCTSFKNLFQNLVGASISILPLPTLQLAMILKREGYEHNIKKIYRIYREEGWLVKRTSVSYNGSSVTATDALGNARNYTFTTLFGVVKPATVTGAVTKSAGGQAFTYDVNG
jgi:hypothetical protein